MAKQGIKLAQAFITRLPAIFADFQQFARSNRALADNRFKRQVAEIDELRSARLVPAPHGVYIAFRDESSLHPADLDLDSVEHERLVGTLKRVLG